MRHIAIAAVLILVGGAALAMNGGPVFCVGPQMTSMTVEVSQANLQLPSDRAGDGWETAVSQRGFLVARYGLSPGCDFAARVGSANLSFSDLPSGYSDVTGSWAFAWGASARLGFPLKPDRYQVIAAVDYVGFQPTTSTTLGQKTIESEYLWNEVSPSLTAGYRFGWLLPYVGVMKPYLFGRRDVKVTLQGQELTSAGGASDYSDGEQPLRGLLGFEWRLPDGYSFGAEVAGDTEGMWTLSIGLAQVLK